MILSGCLVTDISKQVFDRAAVAATIGITPRNPEYLVMKTRFELPPQGLLATRSIRYHGNLGLGFRVT